jgi:hypothetical protein
VSRWPKPQRLTSCPFSGQPDSRIARYVSAPGCTKAPPARWQAVGRLQVRVVVRPASALDGLPSRQGIFRLAAVVRFPDTGRVRLALEWPLRGPGILPVLFALAGGRLVSGRKGRPPSPWQSQESFRASASHERSLISRTDPAVSPSSCILGSPRCLSLFLNHKAACPIPPL